MPDDRSAIPASDAKRLFAGLARAPAIVLAVSGGPDSVALMWLAARWRRALAQGPRLVAVTVDHGLRVEAAREARDVKRLARSLDLPHHTLRWSGPKPSTGVPAAAREARYGLLAQAARKHGATHIVTAHTRDDQAETLLMRMLRGSGVAGLSAMARETERDGVMLTRPLLDISKAQLIATLKKARISFADDPTNRDPSFTRPRLRALMPLLAEEGGDARNLARLAARIARANAALEVLVDGAEGYLALKSEDNFDAGFDAALFAVMPDEIRLRLLKRAIDRTGHEGPAELGKVETLLAAVDEAVSQRSGQRESKLKQTLAGAVISVASGRIRISPAPPRRARSR
ncbi:tRNA lysidine(34) synthetase TilS [Bradyrhizobium sp. B097]|uniref:tRNA lysidine(34) synthetase TilS n=1 Tax=Bradyrhizobium sp. B097 TaxID=3140244 RepID=UPI0031842E26